MGNQETLAQRFEAYRAHLRGVAYRMLGSLDEADDAVQEAWLRLCRSNASDIDNLGGWLTTVVARLCLDILRVRTSRREEALGEDILDTVADPRSATEGEVHLADSVGVALLVVLDRLSPAERLAFVLHDVFGRSFEEIAPIVRRSPAAARKLASRARHRVRGGHDVSGANLARQHDIAQAFLSASRDDNFNALVAILDPEVTLRADAAAAPGGKPLTVSGAQAVAKGALAFSGRVRFSQLALVNHKIGVLVAPLGRLSVVLEFTMAAGKITEIDVIADPKRLRELDLAVLGN
jgi:RNA polymerase sigma factor (sigma-70 family)